MLVFASLFSSCRVPSTYSPVSEWLHLLIRRHLMIASRWKSIFFLCWIQSILLHRAAPFFGCSTATLPSYFEVPNPAMMYCWLSFQCTSILWAACTWNSKHKNTQWCIAWGYFIYQYSFPVLHGVCHSFLVLSLTVLLRSWSARTPVEHMNSWPTSQTILTTLL